MRQKTYLRVLEWKKHVFKQWDSFRSGQMVMWDWSHLRCQNERDLAQSCWGFRYLRTGLAPVGAVSTKWSAPVGLIPRIARAPSKLGQLCNKVLFEDEEGQWLWKSELRDM